MSPESSLAVPRRRALGTANSRAIFMNRLGPRAVNLALAMASLVVTLLVLELVVRLVYGAPPRWRVPQVKHQVTSYGHKLVPGQTAYSGGAPVYSNAHGFRGPDWSVPKPAGVLRVMVLGDSLSFGNLVPYEDTFAARLPQVLAPQGAAVEVILTAVGGWDTATELAFLEEEGLRYEPDVVILGFFYNDYRLPSPSARPVVLTDESRVDERPPWLRWVPYPAIYAAKRSALVAFARNRVANFLSGRPGHADFFNALMANQVALDGDERIAAVHEKLARMNALCAAHGIRLLVVHLPPINLFWHVRGSRQYVAHLQRFCRERRIPFLDLADRFWREERRDGLYMYPWDNHLSSRGHAVAAEELARLVVQTPR